jgi:hypothetical protein
MFLSRCPVTRKAKVPNYSSGKGRWTTAYCVLLYFDYFSHFLLKICFSLLTSAQKQEKHSLDQTFEYATDILPCKNNLTPKVARRLYTDLKSIRTSYTGYYTGYYVTQSQIITYTSIPLSTLMGWRTYALKLPTSFIVVYI